MTAFQLLALSLVVSVLTTAAGWMIVRSLERRVTDAALRERIWAVALYLPLLPVVIVGLFLVLPARVVRVADAPVWIAPITPSTTATADTVLSAAQMFQTIAPAVVALAALLCFARIAHTGLRLLRLRRLMRTTAPASAELQMRVEEMARRLGVAAPALRVVPTGAEAFLSGLRHPVLVLPNALAALPDQPAIAAVCAHELAHLRRGDHRALWAEELLLALLAINPLLGALRRRRAAAREEACDALALAGADTPTRRAYARALLAALRDPAQQDDVPALTFTPSKRTFAMLRLQAILTPTPSAAPRLRRLSTALGAVMAAGVCTASVALAAQREPSVEVVPAFTVEIAPEALKAPVVTPSVLSPPVSAPHKAMEVAASAPPRTPAPALAAATAEVVRPSFITNPSWAQLPVPQFPASAVSANVDSGRVVLNCAVRADGRLGDCAVVSEDPAGNGFGPAALSAAREARLSPRTVDEAAPNAIVVFSLFFRLG